MPSVNSSPRPLRWSERQFSQSMLPTEILDHVVDDMLLKKRAFATIASFSTASYQFRQIAFRRFFSVLSVSEKRYWLNCCKIPGIFNWVRILNATTTALSAQTRNLLQFHYLDSLAVDFSAEGSGTHHTRAQSILSNLSSACSLHLTHLEFSFLPSISPCMLSLIARTCPRLESLVLDCSARLVPDCCWTCYEEAASCTVHSPIPDTFCDVDHLTRAFGEALAPLSGTLRHLQLGIYLSEVDRFYEHLDHSQSDAPAHPFDWLSSLPFSPLFCLLCQQVEATRTTEVAAAVQLGGYLGQLESVCWSTWYDEHGKDEAIVVGADRVGRCTIWLRRREVGGEVRVEGRRKPW